MGNLGKVPKLHLGEITIEDDRPEEQAYYREAMVPPEEARRLLSEAAMLPVGRTRLLPEIVIGPDARAVADSAVAQANAAFDVTGPRGPVDIASTSAGPARGLSRLDSGGAQALAAPPLRPQGTRPPSVYDPHPDDIARWGNEVRQQQIASNPAGPVVGDAKGIAQERGPLVSSSRSLPSSADLLANAIADQRRGDAVAQAFGGLTTALTGGRAQGQFQGSTALQDYLTQRDAGIQERNRKLLEDRQVVADQRDQQSHDARIRNLDQQFAAAQADAALGEMLRDPSSEESERARQAYIALGQELGVEGIEQMVGGQSAYTLRQSPEFQRLFEYATDKGLINERGQYTRYRRRSGGFGSGSRRPESGPDAQREIFLDVQERQFGRSPEEAQRAWDAVSADPIAVRDFLRNVTDNDFGGVQGRFDDARMRHLGADMGNLQRISTALDLANRSLEEAGDLNWLERGAASIGSGSGLLAGAVESMSPAQVRRLAQRVRNLSVLQLRDESGAAIADSEWDTKRAQLGNSLTQGPEAMREALRDATEFQNRLAASVRAGYKPEELAEHQRRFESGMQSPAVRPSASSAGAQPAAERTATITLVKDGETRQFRGTREELRPLLGQGWRPRR